MHQDGNCIFKRFKMKKLIIVIFISFLFGCTDDDVLHANLRMVNDEIEIRTDEMDNYINVRSIHVYYLAINKSNDSIFIPIGYPYENQVTIDILSRNSLETLYLGEKCTKFNGCVGQQLFASGDSILISSWFLIYPRNSNDSEWLRKVSTKELMSKMELKMVKSTEGKDTGKIPNIIFNNDTNDICINPVLKARKNL